MAKLCYKSGGTIKKYDLKDSVSGTPKLGVKIGGTTKYLGLKQGTKSGEITVKVGGLPYYVKTIVDYTESSPVVATGLTFYIAQSTADGYAWLTNDVANNVALCKMYGMTYGQAINNGIYMDYNTAKPYYEANNDLAVLNSITEGRWVYMSRAEAHNYLPDVWGGTGPHRMYAQTNGATISEHPYYHVTGRPFYFLYSDNNLVFHTPTNDRTREIVLYDVLKNGSSTRSLRSTSTPILFEEGDTITIVIYFGGYNTRSTFQPTFTYNPTVRWAD